MSAQILDLALAAHQRQDVSQAKPLYQAVLASTPDEPKALYGLGMILLSEGSLTGIDLIGRALFSVKSESIPGFSRKDAALSAFQSLMQQQFRDHAKQLLQSCVEHGLILDNLPELENLVRLPAYLTPARLDPKFSKTLERYHPIESSHYVYAIDIVGGCNLRCPTCPVSDHDLLPKGLMDIALYEQILNKIRKESHDPNPDIWLFNWTEPLIHPKIEDFIHLTHSYGFTSFISTNLNIGSRIPDVMRAKPTRLKVSLSSFSQEIYGKTHARGHIDKVLENLKELARWRDHYQAQTQIWIGHHLYKNTLHEQNNIAAFAQSLGFGYAPSPAIVAPIEKALDLIQAPGQDRLDGLREQLLFDPVLIQQSMAPKRSGNKDCELRFNMTAINHLGEVQLCCGTTHALGAAPTQFLEFNHERLEEMKYHNAFCSTCMKANLHLTIADQ